MEINTNNKYKNGKIYKLKCSDSHYYIGSTINELCLRIKNHKVDSKKYIDRKVYKHINTLGWENVTIELIELFPCDSRTELIKRETYYIQLAKKNFDMLCLNIINAYTSDVEKKENMKKYYYTNKNTICQNVAVYRKKNQEKIKEYRKVYNKVFADKRNEYQKHYVVQNKEKVSDARHLRYEKNKEQELQKNKEYAQTHKEQMAKYKQKWAQLNPEKVEQSRMKSIENRIKRREIIEPVQCVCGAIIKPYNMSVHKRSKRHITNAAVLSGISAESVSASDAVS